MTLCDTQAVALACNVSVRTVFRWAATRPHELPRRGTDPKGRTLFALEEALGLAVRMGLRAGHDGGTISNQVGFAMPASRSTP